MDTPHSTPEPQSSAEGCIIGILALVTMLALFCFAIAAVIVTVKWALGR